MIVSFAVREFRAEHAGTFGGALWALLPSIALVGVFYVVFAVGLRVQSPANTPFVLWFVVGLSVWIMFNDSLSAITASITGSAHLIKKTSFPPEALPLIKLLTHLFSHIIFLAIIGILLIVFDVQFLLERVIFVYYLLCLLVLTLALGLIFAAIAPFFRDLVHALRILLNIVFWATPIVWPNSILPAQYQIYASYNPISYIIEGYRNSLIYDKVIWPSLGPSVLFWVLTLTLLMIGGTVFLRLKSEFADFV